MAFSPGLPECSRPNLPIDRAGPAFRHTEKTGTRQSVRKLAKANQFFLPQRRYSPIMGRMARSAGRTLEKGETAERCTRGNR
jgi:hypothetical protein